MPRGTHTPGNWTFDEGSGEITSDIDEHGFLVATVESNDADGPLIAASPKLLKAARVVCIESLLNGSVISEAALRDLRRAVDEAEGVL